jgi:ArsR family transcriptional regulator
VTKRLALAEPSNRPTTGPAPKPRLRGRALASLATMFKALSDETRLSILAYLAASEDATCVCHLEDYVKHLSQPTISHHLRLLREAGLVKTDRRGTWIHYAIEPSLRTRLNEFLSLLGS